MPDISAAPDESRAPRGAAEPSSADLSPLTRQGTPLRILHVLNHVEEIGNGIVNAVVDLACTQASLGHSVGVASVGGEFEALLARQGVTHFSLNQKRTPGVLLRAVPAFREIVRTFRPEIVDCHMMTGMVLARAVRGRAPYRLVSHIHNVHQRSAVLMGLADRVISLSDIVRQDMARRGVPDHKMRVVVNRTLGNPRIGPLSACPPAELKQPAVVTVAGMSERKGIAELIAAFEKVSKRFPEAHLYLVGDGPDRPAFEAQAAASPAAPRIHFEGFQKSPTPHLLAAEVFVLASHRDSCPLVIPEARAVGCAIIGSNVDGIPELLDGGSAGVLTPPRDVDALADAIESLLADPAKRAHWKQAARQNLERQTVGAMTEEVIQVYRDLLAGR